MQLLGATLLLAMLARSVAASPVEARTIEARKPVEGESKRGDFNVLGKRSGGPFLLAFGASDCNPLALGAGIYYFDESFGGQCYDTIRFNSVRFDLNGENVGWRPRVGNAATSCFFHTVQQPLTCYNFAGNSYGRNGL